MSSECVLFTSVITLTAFIVHEVSKLQSCQVSDDGDASKSHI